MPRLPQSQSDLEKHLADQLELLKQLCNIYDNGSTVSAKAMATTIRVLLHDTRNSKSLLSQLNKKDTLFYDTAEVITEPQPGTQRAGSFSALLGIGVGATGGYIPYFDKMPGHVARRVSFDDFWNEIIFIDHNNNTFTRKEVVLYVANQDGGSHVDPDLEEKYVQLSRQNSLGWLTSTSEQVEWTELSGAELVSIRQIAHELLRTFSVDYDPIILQEPSLMMGGGGFVLHFADEQSNEPSIPRKSPCPCGSGKKYKRCHGKTAV